MQLQITAEMFRLLMVIQTAIVLHGTASLITLGQNTEHYSSPAQHPALQILCTDTWPKVS